MVLSLLFAAAAVSAPTAPRSAGDTRIAVTAVAGDVTVTAAGQPVEVELDSGFAVVAEDAGDGGPGDAGPGDDESHDDEGQSGSADADD